MTPTNTPTEDSLGKWSLSLGIASSALVFGMGFCAIVGSSGGWINLVGIPLYICAGSSAFLGLIAAGLGAGGVIGKKDKPRGAAIAGILLGFLGICLFLGFLAALGG